MARPRGGRFVYPIGTKIGRWTVTGDLEIFTSGKTRVSYQRCRCECGTEKVVQLCGLKAGWSQSCGCLGKEIQRRAVTKHGGVKTRLYKIWNDMIRRCHGRKRHQYKYWGAKGIVVCNEWRNSFETFRKWALENGYRNDLEIDRIDGSNGYSPDNCRWATDSEQNLNRVNIRMVSAFGETKPLSHWATDSRCVVSQTSLKKRLRRGMVPEDAIASPKKDKWGNVLGK